MIYKSTQVLKPTAAELMLSQTTQNWQPDSWQSRPIAQQPAYADEAKLRGVLNTLREYPPLVFAGEVDALKRELARCSAGKAFLLQGGDCAERFKDCNERAITSKLKILLQMSVVICHGVRRPVVRVGRFAGQYGKPRSADWEEVDGLTLPVFRGDNVNAFEPDPIARLPDPLRLLQGYHTASLTLNYIRALTGGGFADLHYPDTWHLDFAERSPLVQSYTQVLAEVRQAIAVTESLGSKNSKLKSVAFYTSHEGLLLNYEEAMTHFVAPKNRYYNLGAHMLWIGDRTRQLDGAHVEYCRGIANPIGIKVGPKAIPGEIVDIVRALNPTHEPGKITLITRLGDQDVQTALPALIREVQKADAPVCWSSDPMHGNAIKTADNIKTRDFNAILRELQASFQIHQEMNSQLGGVHFELTGENVTECIGGTEEISIDDLSKSYETYCDPRLNYSQSLEMAFHIARMLPTARTDVNLLSGRHQHNRPDDSPRPC